MVYQSTLHELQGISGLLQVMEAFRKKKTEPDESTLGKLRPRPTMDTTEVILDLDAMKIKSTTPILCQYLFITSPSQGFVVFTPS